MASELLFATYACGNRYHFGEGDVAPSVCPHDDCEAGKEGVYVDD
jgi:hypothetical protein